MYTYIQIFCYTFYVHGEKIIGFFPILSIAKLTYFDILVICPIVYGDSDIDYTDNLHSMG